MRKAWNILTAAGVAATLTLAGCTEDGPVTVTEATTEAEPPEAPEASDRKAVFDGWLVPAGGPSIVVERDGCQSLWYRKWTQDAPMSEHEARAMVLDACRDRSEEELEKKLKQLVPRLTAEPFRLPPVPEPEVRR